MPNPVPPKETDVAVDSVSHQRGFYRSHGAKILIGFLLLAPVYLSISARVLTPGDMSAYLLDVSHWLPQDSLLIQDMEMFSEVVGEERGNVVRVSWTGCTEQDPRLHQFATALRSLNWGMKYHPGEPDKKIFDEVITIDTVVAKLKNSDARLSEQQVYGQLENVLIGPTGTTCVVATLPTRQPESRAFAIRQIYDVANQINGLQESDIRLFGGPVYTKKIDDSGVEIATRLTPFAVLISLILAWFCLRKFSAMIAIFLNAIVGTCAALVSLHLTQAVMDPLLMLLPGFWFIMSVSAGMHFVNYYFETIEKFGTSDHDLSFETVKIAFWPTLLATVTTCIGLGSLCTSEILPLWRFGFHASLGLICSFVALFLFLPSFLRFVEKRLVAETEPRKTFGIRFWDWYAVFSTRFKHKTAMVFLLLLMVASTGFLRLGFSNKLRDQFSESSQINSDAAWFEEEIGPLLPFELLVRFPKSELPRPSDCLEFVHTLQNRIDALTLPTKTLSATSVVPYDAGTGARQAIRRAIIDKRLTTHRASLADTGFVIDEADTELWRISVFAYNSTDVTMDDYFSEILDVVHEQKQAYQSDGIEPRISYAGLGSRMAVITRKLGGGLMQSCFTSAILIALVVIVALRSFTLGLTAMLPNIFPILVSFGAFGFFQPSLDIGSIMTASIAMGIAVDDTIHFMYWFQKGIKRTLSRVEAIKLAIHKCGRAIASTTLICGLGFFAYFFCDFMPVARFGQLLFIMLGAALVGDLCFLPALLQSLPSRFFESPKPPEPQFAKHPSPTQAAN